MILDITDFDIGGEIVGHSIAISGMFIIGSQDGGMPSASFIRISSGRF